MDNAQAQPWWQFEDDKTKYNVKDIELGMNKEINQMINNFFRRSIEQGGRHSMGRYSGLLTNPVAMEGKRSSATSVAKASPNTSMTRMCRRLLLHRVGWQ
eukprot:6491915-Amphidinium_carterae.3